MASSGNPNQSIGFDMQKLFKPGNPQNPNTVPPPGYGAMQSAPQFPIPYSTQQHPNVSNLQGPTFPFPPHATPYHHYLHYPPETHPSLRPPFTNAPVPSSPQQQLLPTNQTHLPSSSSAPAPNHGARLMALLGSQFSSSDPLGAPIGVEFASSATTSSTETYTQLTTTVPVLPKMPTAPPISLAGMPPVQVAPGPLPSSRQPNGRHINGDHVVYDIDERVQGEVQPQLEVNPITKYVSDPGLVIGRQIAVNGTYICYGLKPGAIRVLNINTASRHLLKGHSQRVTDMAFFAEDVHLLASASMDGRVFIWKITEGPDPEEKPQVAGKVILALQMVGDRELLHPRVCWHTHKQEVLMVGIGNYVLKIDTTKVAKGDASAEEEPIKCLLDNPIDGISCIGKHDGDVTDLSICQWMSLRLASASTDGTVKIWGDRKSSPLAILKPHEGQPVNSVSFLVAPEHPDHIVLLTTGPFSRELKLWASASPEGWLLHSEVEDWLCMQTLELKSSSETSVENSFFNQVVVLPCAGLILLANAKRNAIYAIHLEYGPNPSATRMNFIAEFTVTMPILSLTGTTDPLTERQCIVQIYCVQTQAIQQYTLDLFQCLPPHVGYGVSDLTSSGGPVLSSADGLTQADLPKIDLVKDMVVGDSRSKSPLHERNSENTSADMAHSLSAPLEVIIPRSESNPNVLKSSHSDGDNICVQSPNLPQSPRQLGRISGTRSPPKRPEQWASPSELGSDQIIISTRDNLPDTGSSNAHIGNDTLKIADNNRSLVPCAAVTFDLKSNPAHLITPSEILSLGLSSDNTADTNDLPAGETFVQDVSTNHEIKSTEVEVKVVGGGGGLNHDEAEPHILTEDKRERTFYPQAPEINSNMIQEYCPRPDETPTFDETLQLEESVRSEEDQPSVEQGGHISRKDAPVGSTELSVDSLIPQSPTALTKGRKQKINPSQPSRISSASPSPFNSMDSSNCDPGASSGSPAEVSYTQILQMQDSLNQLMTMHKEMQKQMNIMITIPISKEGRRIEAALARHVEKIIKANVDAMWARMLEESTRHEKVERDRVQQITTLISNVMNKEFPSMMDRTLKKEIAAIGPTITKSVVSVLDKTIPSAVADSFQRGIGDKAMNQLEKSICSKLETAVSRQIQAQVQSSVKQTLQDAVKSSIESSLIPAFELSCKSMFEQVDATFRKGIGEYVAAVHQQLESTHTSLALGLREGINSLASAVQTLNTEVAEGQRKILAFAASRANPITDAINNAHLSNGPRVGMHALHVEAPPDPTKELTRLISEHKFDEAFTLALQSTDLSLVSWLCSQVNLMMLFSTKPLPLSQGVLLSLIQQLAFDLSKDTSLKLSWVTEVAMSLNPSDPLIIMHARSILEQVYQSLVRRSLAASAAGEESSIRMVMHVVSSTLKSCK